MVLWPSRDLLQLNIELPVKNSRRLSYIKRIVMAIKFFMCPPKLVCCSVCYGGNIAKERMR